MACSVLVMLAVFMSSCKQDQEAPSASTTSTSKTLKMSGVSEVKGKFTVQDGILHFEDSKALFDVLEQLRLYDVSERRNFGKDIGFKSMLSVFCDVLVKSATIEDKDKYFALLKQNADVVSYKDDGSFDFKTATPFMASVTNRDGILYIGKGVYQYTDYGEVIILDGDINRLSSVTRNTPTDKNIKVFITKEELSLRVACGTGLFNTVWNASNDRAGDLYSARQGSLAFQGYDANNIPYYDVYNSSYVSGTPWKKVCFFGCSWKKYSTSNTLSINQTLQSYNGSCQYSDNFSYSNNWDFIDYVGNSCTSYAIPEPPISQYYSYYTSMNPNTYLMNNTSVVVTQICN